MFETLFMAGLLVSVTASLPVWSYSRQWGFKLSALLGVVLYQSSGLSTLEFHLSEG